MSRPRKTKFEKSSTRMSPPWDYSILKNRLLFMELFNDVYGVGIEHDDPFFLKYQGPDNEGLAVIESLIKALTIARIDPLNQNPAIAYIMAPLITGSDINNKQSSEFVASKIALMSADNLEEMFRCIVAFKRNMENSPHRNCYAMGAYVEYLIETKKEPTKATLRKYMIARPELYRDQPSPEDKKGWTRMWEDSGLFKLDNR